MPYKINDSCTCCGTCKDTCPSEAIQEGEKIYSIDRDACVECGVCVDACPASAIIEE